MAKQISPVVKLRGKLDDLSFYKTVDGYLTREKGGVSGERIKSDPKFDRTRRNGLEFGIGGKAGKLFRQAFNAELARAADFRVGSRITQLMVKILQTDPTSKFGSRQVQLGTLSMLKNFNFNNEVMMDQSYKLPIVAAINRSTGVHTISLPVIKPMLDIAVPDGTTHYRIFAAAAQIDFGEGLAETVRDTTAFLPWTDTATVADTLSMSLTDDPILPIFMVMGIEYTKMVNGDSFPASKGQSALQIVAIDVP